MSQITVGSHPGKHAFGSMLLNDAKKYKYLYIMILPVVVYYFLFSYMPMYGILMAFQDYDIAKGVIGSEWVGFMHFIDFFQGAYFERTLINTLLLNVYGLIFVFPLPIIFALLINELRIKTFKRISQTVSYLPFFISVVVIAGIITDFTSQNGVITHFYKIFTDTTDSVNLLTKPELFRPIYILSSIWQHTGFDSIIYISALSAINPELYEAAIIDGSGRWKRMLHVTLPGIAPTIIILFILQFGHLMSVGFDKAFLLQNPSIYETADVISTYIYRQGLQYGQYGFSTAVGLFNTVINFILLISANAASRKINEVSLF